MISIAALKPEQAARYFEQDNYFSKDACEENSFWWGKGAAKLGLSGHVKSKEFALLCRGYNKEGTAQIVSGKRGEDLKRAGTDLCFSAPKSVSLASLVGGDTRLIEAHAMAVQKALKVVEERYACARSGGANDRSVDQTGNLSVACFQHDTSRHKDPQLHTHCVVLNMTERRDGKWRAVFFDPMFDAGKLAGTIYQAELAKHCKELGYEVVTHSNGTFDIEGYSDHQLRAFSKRTEKIKALGCTSKAEERVEKMKIRPPKGAIIPTSELKEYWQAECREMNVQHPDPQIGKAKAVNADAREKEASTAFEYAKEHLSERVVKFSRANLETQMLARSLGDVTWEDAQKQIKEARKRGELRNAVNPRTESFTTDVALRREEKSSQIVLAGFGACAPIVSRDVVEHRVGAIQQLPVERQRDVEERLRTICGPSVTAKTDRVLERVFERLGTGEKLGVTESRQLRRDLLETLSTSENGVSQILGTVFESCEGLSKGQRAAIVETATTRDRFISWQGVAGAGP
jgi:conjugative relaxase-like TrwC/TraI family protein